MIQNIEITKLHPHSGNPRRDLGDLAELAESIKVSGVLQNLTVVPQPAGYCTSCKLFYGGQHCEGGHNEHERPPCSKWESKGNYTVVIGHRRLAAAKLAGLTEVPCVVSDMDKREQIATMLLENMQRSDLTVYEQAQGFQMMLNLGDSVNNISERTGFSESTVRRRVKLLELDRGRFKEATDRGATLLDFMELDKIKSVDRKNAVLEKIGTSNFQYELKRAVDEEEQEERTTAWVEVLSTFATQVETTDGYRREEYYNVRSNPDVEKPEDADTVEYFFNVGKWGSIYLLKKDDGQEPETDPEEQKRREWLEWRRRELKEATRRAFTLREEFVRSLPATKIKKSLAVIVTMATWAGITSYSDIDEEDFLGLLGVDPDTVKKDEDGEKISSSGLATVVEEAPERALLVMAYCLVEDSSGDGYYQHWSAQHCENEGLDHLYASLEKLGYAMSDEERALQSGEHDLFKDAESDEAVEDES